MNAKTKIKKKIPGMVIEALIEGRNIRFFVHNPEDHIQKFHANGQFYEREELALMSRFLTADAHYVDVGANIGNHVIYFGKSLGVQNIVVIEPNPLAAAILEFNVLLNGLTDVVDFAGLGYGLSDVPGNADILIPRANMGAAKLTDSGDGKVSLITGDEILNDKPVDFVKIDTEGMEMKCLRGLEQTIRRCHPAMFVEVDNANIPEFKEWCSAHEYRVATQLRRYVDNENFLVTHASQSVSS